MHLNHADLFGAGPSLLGFRYEAALLDMGEEQALVDQIGPLGGINFPARRAAITALMARVDGWCPPSPALQGRNNSPCRSVGNPAFAGSVREPFCRQLRYDSRDFVRPAVRDGLPVSTKSVTVDRLAAMRRAATVLNEAFSETDRQALREAAE